MTALHWIEDVLSMETNVLEKEAVEVVGTSLNSEERKAQLVT